MSAPNTALNTAFKHNSYAVCLPCVQVMVELVGEAELAGSWAGASGVGPTGERRSKRARKSRQPVLASSSMTLWQFKLAVYEVLHVHPRNQRVSGVDMANAQL